MLALIPLYFMQHRNSRVAKVEAKPKTFADYLAVASPGLFLAAELATWHTSLHMISDASGQYDTDIRCFDQLAISWLVKE